MNHRAHGRSAATALIAAATIILLPCVCMAARSKAELFALAMNGQFTEIDGELTSLQNEFERTGDFDVEDQLANAFNAFRNCNSKLEGKLHEWRDKAPASCAVRAALGQYQLTMAEIARGGRWAKDTRTEEFHSMADYLEQAQSSYEAALACNQSLTVAWVGLIVIAELNGDDTLLERARERGLSAQPKSLAIRLQYLYALSPKWMGSLEDVDAYLLRTKGEVPAEKFAELESMADRIHAAALIDDGKKSEAEMLLDRAVARTGSWSVLSDRGDNLLAMGRFEEALADYNQALAKRPAVAGLLADRARALEKLGRFDEALTDINEAMVYDDRRPEFLDYRSWLLAYKLNRSEEGSRDAHAATTLGAQRAYVWVNEAYALLNTKKDPEAARAVFLQAIELDPDEAEAWYGYGLALYAQFSSGSLDAFDHYLYLCNQHDNCRADNVAFLNVVVHHYATWLNWPRVLFRPHLMGLLL
jgi:tetratricopeptide (TPR) repeat protein